MAGSAEPGDALEIGLWSWGGPTGVLRLDARARSLLGLAPGGGVDLGGLLEHVHPEDRERVASEVTEAVEHRRAFTTSARIVTRGGRCTLVCRGQALGVGTGTAPGGFHGAVWADASDEVLEARERSRHGNRVEALGRLAVGVSHDFSNILTAILAFSRFALETLDSDDPARGDVEEALRAAQRAERLTARLLAFVRRRPASVRAVDLNSVVIDVEAMLRRVLRDDIELSTRLAPGLWRARADAVAVEQVLVNLAVNARDAMPRGGRVEVQTRNVRLGTPGPERALDGHPTALAAGDYVVFSVRDDGVGMSPTTRARIFEPFFTTKEAGAGTGLGLATCMSVVREAGGELEVESEPGEGTTVTVYLPRSLAQPAAAPGEPEGAHAGGTESVLIVEDDEAVRVAAERALERFGYRVHVARSPMEGLLIASKQPVDLLLTDVMLDGMRGEQLARHVRAHQPHARVVLMSGYEPLDLSATDLHDARILAKPFTPSRLGRAVRGALDQLTSGPTPVSSLPPGSARDGEAGELPLRTSAPVPRSIVLAVVEAVAEWRRIRHALGHVAPGGVSPEDALHYATATRLVLFRNVEQCLAMVAELRRHGDGHGTLDELERDLRGVRRDAHDALESFEARHRGWLIH